MEQVFRKGSAGWCVWSMWHQLKQPEWKCRSNVWEGTTDGCKFQEAWFVGGKNIFWKLSITVIILMGVEHDWWDNLYTHCQLFDPKTLIGTCLMDSRKLLLIPVLPPFRHSQCYFCWHVFYFFPMIWKQHALPTSDTFAIYKPVLFHHVFPSVY